ncbi:hypothetical protein PHJA_001625100 [Phtheirospermum japonicum]|uniref:GTD-binding domain-containing protein n=1 Tax=Phtheirospermum japonicum TaxID=374723 RepID=A0A830C2E2_9LAMI|nr:hypothetical protein PHJA_001625100 [Phtheirospermum japonicum]
MSEAEISILKETLCAQQQLLQKLYNELDAEREASATSASEALSVILRLQGEKAAVKMEAEQYKRLAEEKMCHAEESFAIIEDIIYQKEMEVAALDYQVQSYRYKLLSMGCSDPGGGEIKYPENLLQRGESLTGDTSIGRRNSAPVLNKYKKAMVDRESSLSPELDLVFKNAEQQMDQELNDFASELDKRADSSTHGGISSYAEEIRRLDTRVKEIAGAKYAISRNETRSPSLSSRPSAGNLSYLSNAQPETQSPSQQLNNSNPYNSNNVSIVSEIDQVKHCSPSVHDVFEVPQVDEKRTDEIFQSKDPVLHQEAIKLSAAGKEEPDWLKKLFQSTSNEKNLCKPSHIAAIDRGVVQPATSVCVSRPVFNLLNEVSGTSAIERVAESTLREEEVKLLKEIKDELSLLKDEIRSQKMNKSSMAEKPSLCHLPEVYNEF